MNSTRLPLLNLFKHLRQYGLPLGVKDYMLALEALQVGFGIGDRQALEQLCCTLWTKSEEEGRLLCRLLRQELALSDAHTHQPFTSALLHALQATSNAPLPKLHHRNRPNLWAYLPNYNPSKRHLTRPSPTLHHGSHLKPYPILIHLPAYRCKWMNQFRLFRLFSIISAAA